jgi:hypothetical protein
MKVSNDIQVFVSSHDLAINNLVMQNAIMIKEIVSVEKKTVALLSNVRQQEFHVFC